MSLASRKWGAWMMRAVVVIGFCTVAVYAYFETRAHRETVSAMSEEQQAVAALLDSRDYGVAVLDHEGRVKKWNPALERWTGYTRKEMLGRTISILMRDEVARRHSETYGERIRKAVASGEVPVISCQIYPKDRAAEPLDVQISAFVVQSANRWRKPYAIALINRVEKVVEVTVDESGEVQKVK